MLKIHKIVTPSPEQWEIIIEGMRNPMNSWDKIDSYKTHIEDPETLETADFEFFLGDNDRSLMQGLAKAGSDHRKFMRMLPVHITVTAPLYWWKEYDTYKVGTVANSCSTMHKIHAKEFLLDDFSLESVKKIVTPAVYDNLIKTLNLLRELYNDWDSLPPEIHEDWKNRGVGRKDVWKAMIELSLSSYNQQRTLFLNYENLMNIYFARRNHKLDEWHTFCEAIEKLPYFMEIIGEDQ